MLNRTGKGKGEWKEKETKKALETKKGRSWLKKKVEERQRKC